MTESPATSTPNPVALTASAFHTPNVSVARRGIIKKPTGIANTISRKWPARRPPRRTPLASISLYSFLATATDVDAPPSPAAVCVIHPARCDGGGAVSAPPFQIGWGIETPSPTLRFGSEFVGRVETHRVASRAIDKESSTEMASGGYHGATTDNLAGRGCPGEVDKYSIVFGSLRQMMDIPYRDYMHSCAFRALAFHCTKLAYSSGSKLTEETPKKTL
uniref:Uncharacterized protein n=1 Tax=Ganoderma boninense TaxID=34458 RepID=A0A5K1K777_9APHY|nr:Uncharacterized protein [Ganoderma boninense]